MKKIQHEAMEQQALFAWAELQASTIPQLRMMYAVPNGGSRNLLEAINLKKQGLKPGVPDVFLAVPSNGYHGLYIEMKYGKNKTTDEQDWWLERLASNGYKTAVCYRWEDAKDLILEYLTKRRVNVDGKR